MRRAVLLTLGAGEILIAVVLIWLACSLPTGSEVQAGFARAERVTSHAGTQVQMFRRQVHTIRQLELRTLAERLKAQTYTLTKTIRTQPVDFTMVSTLRDALGELAVGLGGLSEGLDPRAANRLGGGLDETATFLEETVVPRAGPAIGRGERMQDSETLLKDLAVTLRQAARGIDTTVTRWPEIQKTLSRLAKLVGTARDHLDQAVQRREEYEETLLQTTQLADGLATLLPMLMEQLTGQLDQQDQALDEMGRSIDEFSAVLPTYGRSATQLVQTGRLLTWLVALFVLAHTAYLLTRLGDAGYASLTGVQGPPLTAGQELR